jgi:DNA-binding IclR family transcriptional regulator
MYCTAAGRAYLSALPEQEMLSLVAASSFVRHTHWTECNPKRIVDLLKEAKKNGYAYNKEEYFIGDMTVAAPIMGGSGRPVGAVHVVAPTSRWTLKAACAKLAPSVIEASRGISNGVRAAT